MHYQKAHGTASVAVHTAPYPVGTATVHSPNGEEEFFVDKIVDERTIGKRKQYLVRWVNEGPEEDKWIAAEYLEDNEALDVWLGVRSAP